MHLELNVVHFQPGTGQNFSNIHSFAFLNRYCQAGVVCINIYLKRLSIDRETNQQSSTGSNVGLLPWGHTEPGSDANNVPLLLDDFRFVFIQKNQTLYITQFS